MEKLNIPLSRHTRTTRRKKRVVWPLIFLVITGLFLVWRLSVVTLTRSTLFDAAPTDTVAAIYLNTHGDSHVLFNHLQAVPLISGRGLTLDIIAQWSRGGVAWFFHEDGTRSVAIKAKEADLPTALLRNHEISIQSVRGAVLLSETLQPVEGLDIRVHSPFLPSLNKEWLGTVVFPSSNQHAHFYQHDDYLSLELPETVMAADMLFADSDLALGLSQGPVNLHSSDLAGLDRLLRYVLPENIDSFLFSNSLDQSQVYVEPGTASTLLVLPSELISEEHLIAHLRAIGALQRPLLREVVLEDGTSYDEILVDPDLISVESFSLAGNRAYRVSTTTGTDIVGVYADDHLLLSNQVDFIQLFLSSNDEVLNKHACDGDVGFMRPSTLLSQIRTNQIEPSLSPISGFLSKFSIISIQRDGNRATILFCEA